MPVCLKHLHRLSMRLFALKTGIVGRFNKNMILVEKQNSYFSIMIAVMKKGLPFIVFFFTATVLAGQSNDYRRCPGNAAEAVINPPAGANKNQIRSHKLEPEGYSNKLKTISFKNQETRPAPDS